VGARFMGRILPEVSGDGKEVVVLVATSGDTGGAVANGLLNVPGVKVVVLYPKGKVSPLQEKQFASLGANVTALCVDGVFDDCQRLVKGAFADQQITGRINLTTANSINIARWIPQAVYYLWMYKQLQKRAVISVPSGNFGNFTAGILAYKAKMPARRFIAACNINDTVPRYLESGSYEPRPSIQTVANAMDVGDPSNFERLMYLFGGDKDVMDRICSGAAYTDVQIKRIMSDCYERNGYLLDPHGACGYQALLDNLRGNESGVFMATAHPAKFARVYKDIGIETPVHPTLEALRDKPLLSQQMPNDARALKDILLTL
jgi:threonine synthase